jgi:hypothetical protein
MPTLIRLGQAEDGEKMFQKRWLGNSTATTADGQFNTLFRR